MLASASVHVQHRKMAHGQGAAACSSDGLTEILQISTVLNKSRIAMKDCTNHVHFFYTFFATNLNRPIFVCQAPLSVSLQKMKLPQLPNCTTVSLLPFTQRAPLIMNDNSEISEGCLSKMVGFFDRLLLRVGLQWESVHSTVLSVMYCTAESDEQKQAGGAERKTFGWRVGGEQTVLRHSKKRTSL